ncbi:MAG: Do family serine endopeptidase [Candidatus Neomarinimicrobiota bacterium]|tara:strand:+ start:552 stop:1925 length:1374 start_codon:yes stop_codon:yes gene_type:complete
MKKIKYILFITILFGQNSVVKQFSQAFADVAEKAKPAVVTIITDKMVAMNQFEDFGFFFYPPNQSRQKEFKTNALGSGVIIDSKNGYILTNNHVVDDVDGIKIRLIDKREFEASIVGTDPKSDLAVLQIEASDLTDIKLGNSEKMRVGEWVMAVGSPFSENLSHTVTTGIVSALGRSNIMNSQSYEDFIQTDAAINPGNSGGALLNMDGDLIGINTAIATGGSGRSNRGVGFAIPSNMANRIMGDLIDKGYVTRSWLGVYIQELDSETAEALDIDIRNGALITDVVDGSPAEESGIQEGDVIIEFDGESIANPANLKNVVSLTAPNSSSIVKVLRNGSEKKLKVILEELPEDPRSRDTKNKKEFNDYGFQLREMTKSLREKYELPKEDALVITSVDPNGEAYSKGIREGDIVKRVGTKKVTNLSDFKKYVKRSNSKGSLLLLIKKSNGDSRFYTLYK